MTADVELLPLPAIDSIVKYVEDYARANVEHHTAAKDAEIEALRAEVGELRKRDAEWNRTAGEAVARAERLAKAAEKVLVAASARNVLAMFQAAEALGAALHPTAAQENDDA